MEPASESSIDALKKVINSLRPGWPNLAEAFTDEDLQKLLAGGFRSKDDLEDARRVALRDLGLPPGRVENLKPGNLKDHLLNICGSESIVDYLLQKYTSHYQTARPNEKGWGGRCQAPVSSSKELLRKLGNLRNGRVKQLKWDAVSEIIDEICSHNMVEAALYYFAKIEYAWLYGSGDDSFMRSTVLMSLVGAPSYGRTTALLELIPQMRAYIEQHPAQALELVKAVSWSRTDKQHRESLARLRASLQEGRELVCWLRLNKDPQLLSQEKEGGHPGNTLALRMLYGSLTYMDDLDKSSPAGKYTEFLEGMDATVRARLNLKHVYEFVERLTRTGGARRCFFLLLDDFDAAKPEEGGMEATWAQWLMSTHINWLSEQPRGNRLVIPILGMTWHTDISLRCTATMSARAAVLPLCAPLLSDMQRSEDRAGKKARWTHVSSKMSQHRSTYPSAESTTQDLIKAYPSPRRRAGSRFKG